MRIKNKFNKKGAEKILSIYWFVILIIIAGAVVAMVSLFYGTPYDVRDAEANIMVNKIADCLSENGKINQELFNKSKNFNEDFNLKEKCSFVFETKLKNELEEYFLKADFYDLNNGPEGVSPGVKVFSISEGNYNLYADCKIDLEGKYKRLSKCVDRDFYSLDDSNNVYKINILSVIRKTEKNVK